MWAIFGILVLGASLAGNIMSDVEQAKYQVVETQENIEIRDYEPMIVAETEISGDRKEAVNEGFQMIADYIFGNNQSVQKVEMTAPVIQQASEKIAMTTPVTQQGDRNSWKIRFVMPSNYTMQTLPKPNKSEVEIIEIPSKRFAAIRFSGMAGEESLRQHTNELKDFLNAKKLKTFSEPTYAFFNPPWTLPFMRRNEVMIEIVN